MNAVVRPLYENDGTLGVEDAMMAAFAASMRCGYQKLAMKAVVDYALLRGDNLMAWVECKRRYNESRRYPTFMLSFHKWKEGRMNSIISGKPFLLVVQWDDGLFWVDTGKIALSSVGRGGRTDRNDLQDIEVCAFIDVNDFTRIVE